LLLERLQQHGLVLNAKKCLVGVAELDYLGHRISATGINPIVSRVEALNKYPQPTTISQLQTFLGMINFYRRFLPGAARTLKPLTDVLLRSGKADELHWTEPMKEAFLQCKLAYAQPRSWQIRSLELACFWSSSVHQAVYNPLFSSSLDPVESRAS
jgi:hypothetical protein